MLGVRSCILFLLLLWSLDDARAQILPCTQSGTCQCSDTSGNSIDLTPLQGTDSPAFTGTGDDGDYYEYNPCSGFTDMSSGGACSNVAACQTHIGSYYPIGDVNSATFLQDAQGTYIQYTSTDPGTGGTRTTNVRLTCDKSTESSYTVKGETPSGSSIYEMSLTTKYACLGDSPPPSPSSGPHHPGGGGISIGTILIIVFLSLILVHLIAGSVFNKVKRQETGVAIIPNSSFWKDFPILVKDGAVFVVTKIRGKVGGQGGYESV